MRVIIETYDPEEPEEDTSPFYVALMIALAELKSQVQTLSRKVDQMSQTDQDFQTELSGMHDDIARQTTVANGLKVFVQGLSDRLAAAEQSAQQKGATADELSAIRQLRTDLASNTQAIMDVTTQGTVAATEPAAPVVSDPAAGDSTSNR